MPSSDEPPEIYVDRSLGQVIVPEALRQLGLGWIVFTKDARIRYRVAEISVLAEGGIKAFVLSGGNLSGPEQARRFVWNINRIRLTCRREGPFVFAVRARGIERLWPE